MAEMTMFLPKMPVTPGNDLKRLLARLPQPTHQLLGRRAPPTLVVPDNLVCFRRTGAAQLNRPGRGRALHHRFVLIFPLRTSATICVDDRNLRLGPGRGLLVFPFQFHHYAKLERDDLLWLFVTFELADMEALAPLRYHTFAITPELRGLFRDLVAAYEAERAADLPVLLLALILARLRRVAAAAGEPAGPAAASPGLVMRVNQLVQGGGPNPGIKAIARSLGISSSHLRASFRASCGVSIGRHLRRLRLERARGLLRLGPQRVTEIAELCGFTSIYSFSRAFRSAYGVSPLAYRHRRRRAG